MFNKIFEKGSRLNLRQRLEGDNSLINYAPLIDINAIRSSGSL